VQELVEARFDSPLQALRDTPEVGSGGCHNDTFLLRVRFVDFALWAKASWSKLSRLNNKVVAICAGGCFPVLNPCSRWCPNGSVKVSVSNCLLSDNASCDTTFLSDLLSNAETFSLLTLKATV